MSTTGNHHSHAKAKHFTSGALRMTFKGPLGTERQNTGGREGVIGHVQDFMYKQQNRKIKIEEKNRC